MQVWVMQSRTRMVMAMELAFEKVLSLGVVMLYVRRLMIRPQKGRWKVVGALQLAVLGVE